MLFHARNSTEIETTLENEASHHSDIYATLAPCIPPYLSFYEEKLHLNHHCSYQIEYSELEMFFLYFSRFQFILMLIQMRQNCFYNIQEIGETRGNTRVNLSTTFYPIQNSNSLQYQL